MVLRANSRTSRFVFGSPRSSAKAIATSLGFFLPNISTALFRIPILILGSLATDVSTGTTWSLPIAIGSDQVVPVLTSVARDPKINIGIRNKAVEILGKKNPNDVATSLGFFLPNISTALFRIPILILGSLATDVSTGTTWSLPIAIGSDQVVPVLTSVARDPKINIGIRNKAVEILGKKNPNDVAIAFAELLGDPNTNLEVREFALNTMKGVKEENLVLALLNTYNMGKTQYYSLLNTMLAALGEFDDPEVKKAVIEIAHSNDYPVDIRKKAIDNLAAFNDPSVVDGLLPMLEEKENYIYYDNIINMVYALGEEKKNAESVRRMAFKAHFSRREHD